MGADAIDYALMLLAFGVTLCVVIVVLSIVDRNREVKRLHAMRKDNA